MAEVYVAESQVQPVAWRSEYPPLPNEWFVREHREEVEAPRRLPR